ncbi:MAG: hypothetical protein OHK0039_40330 [Bacteroidia bacterium]
MKYAYLLFVAALGLSIVLPGCNKYPDGPGLSFRSAQSRIATTWRVKQALRDGTDITAEFDTEFFEFGDNGEFRRLETDFVVSIPPFSQDTVITVIGSGTWEFLEENTQIELFYTYTFYDPYNSSVLYRRENNERWDIDRLAEGELWLSNETTRLRFEFFNE